MDYYLNRKMGIFLVRFVNDMGGGSPGSPGSGSGAGAGSTKGDRAGGGGQGGQGWGAWLHGWTLGRAAQGREQSKGQAQGKGKAGYIEGSSQVCLI